MTEPEFPVSVRFAYSRQFGFDKIPAAENENEGHSRDFEMRLWAKALCYVIASDGEASEEEVLFAKGFVASYGFPDTILDLMDGWAKEGETKSLDDVAAEIKEILTHGESLAKAGPAILHAAIAAAAADGLDEKEVEAVKVVGKELGISDDTIQKLVDLVLEEEKLRTKRISLFFPMGHPCLMERFMPK